MTILKLRPLLAWGMIYYGVRPTIKCEVVRLGRGHDPTHTASPLQYILSSGR